eukprot:8966032-Pyramimonas_sp.AAC.1
MHEMQAHPFHSPNYVPEVWFAQALWTCSRHRQLGGAGSSSYVVDHLRELPMQRAWRSRPRL